MKIKSIISCIFIITFLLIWWIQGRYTDRIEYSIENFLSINTYLKRTYYRILSEIKYEKKSIKDVKLKSEEIQKFLIPLSKKVTKGLCNYIRGNEILEDIKKNNISKEINIFILPDTFITSLGFNYYKTLVEHIELFFEESEKRNKSTNYKDYLEKIIEKKEIISS